MNIPAARCKLARIRCLQDCIKCLQELKPLPESLCYVSGKVVYYSPRKTTLKLYEEADVKSKKICDISCTVESRLYASGEEHCNSSGKWIAVKKFLASTTAEPIIYKNDAWLLLYSSRSSTEEAPAVVSIADLQSQQTWEDVVVETYSLKIPKYKTKIEPPDEEAVSRLRSLPPGWTLEHDVAMVKLMSQHLPPDNEQLGTIKTYVESIDVSSFCEDDGPENLTDGSEDTFWESDGNQGQHWIQLRMKKGTVIKKLYCTVDGSDDNYLPSRFVVQGGEQDNLKIINTVHIDWSIAGRQDILLLDGATEHYSVIMIRIKESGGIDTRIRGIKLTSTEERSLGFDRDFFAHDNLVRYPILEGYSPDQLYRRSIVLQRFITILDSVLNLMVPSWQYSVGSYKCLEIIRQFLRMSKKKQSLIDIFLKATVSEPPEKPIVYVNRRSAMEHRCNPSLDPQCKQSVFIQLYEGLKPRDRLSKPLDYRFPANYEQWWECKFLSEGIIDQGGGFRDSLSDLAEELCPTTTDGPIPLPYFIRAPNQGQDDPTASSDVYIPNPACSDFEKYEWIGQLMGACFRGRENLILSLPRFVWKKLVGESVSWTPDFTSVDAAEVYMVNELETMEEKMFNAVTRHWSMLLSDGNMAFLRIDEDGNPLPLSFEDRKEYCEKVREMRMTEFDEQIAALRCGLMKNLPIAVLDLLPWQELETKVCGEPNITIEALRKTTHYDDLEEDDIRVKYLWEALKKFSNEDRSRFLRFVTGRRRLPAPLYISSGKGDAIDSLPESSTCGNMLYLPYYSSAKVAEEKIRYAAYNCIAIDTDMNPWED
ncbi:E3 ubiquitin-protein ligase HECTD3-like isoform X2 [Gigantopelta aegis]|uniref:E3 ubiquitin-protein ligase HECTD3-like isoform X2 n=1 Tax=Gigantopelta aegis TaxID=1735272 RepID=UPI001B88956D|nr:E3 ubiquitin-protein ligase HECTD3-like isoform X2 [Gigantopelta aegis]